jgi:hypothetical protein
MHEGAPKVFFHFIFANSLEIQQKQTKKKNKTKNNNKETKIKKKNNYSLSPQCRNSSPLIRVSVVNALLHLSDDL